jgi:hypothetical protein
VVGGTAGQVLAKIDSTDYNTQWVNQSGGGVASVAGTGAISSSGGTAPVISIADAGTATVGAVQLSDSTSTTSSVLAATPTAVKAAYDIVTSGWEYFMFGASNVTAVMSRNAANSNANLTANRLYHMRLAPHKNLTISNISFVSGTTAAGATPILVRFGIYTRSGTTFTLVAQTASDTSIFSTTNTKYTRALDTTGGYPATYDMTAGQEYWVSFLVRTSAGAPNALAGIGAVASVGAAVGVMMYTENSQTDLPATSTGAASTAQPYWAEVS